ncbi:MAG: NusG domain II-containing protein [Lachnospiraceae bacterium]|nr:NusG domain II-containing protein [Lachnospiraceae bacterium]
MKQSSAKKALIITISLIALTCISLISIFTLVRKSLLEQDLIADIYQNGKLIQSIPLNHVQEPYIITLTDTDGGTNTIEVRQGAIGIIAADCPDKICVNQGFIINSLTPITCLPHRLVIEIRGSSTTDHP